MRTRMRMIAAGATVALLTGTAGGAVASATSSASPSSPSSPDVKPSPTSTGKPGDQDTWLDRLAASLHVSPEKLGAALRDAKETIGRLGAGPLDPAVVSVVSHDLDISAAQARTLLTQVFGDSSRPPGKPKTTQSPGAPDPQLIRTLATILGISESRAADVLHRLDVLSQSPQGVTPDDPRFKAIADSLHITAQRLADALSQMKQKLAAAAPSPSTPASPNKS